MPFENASALVDDPPTQLWPSVARAVESVNVHNRTGIVPAEGNVATVVPDRLTLENPFVFVPSDSPPSAAGLILVVVILNSAATPALTKSRSVPFDCGASDQPPAGTSINSPLPLTVLI